MQQFCFFFLNQGLFSLTLIDKVQGRKTGKSRDRNDSYDTNNNQSSTIVWPSSTPVSRPSAYCGERVGLMTWWL